MSVTLFNWINERYRKPTLPKTYDIIFVSKCIYIINERYVLDVFDRLHPNKSFKTVLIPVIFFFFFFFFANTRKPLPVLFIGQ